MCLASTLKKKIKILKTKNDVWETISIFDIYIYIYIFFFLNLQKVTCRRLPFFLVDMIRIEFMYFSFLFLDNDKFQIWSMRFFCMIKISSLI